MRARKILYKKNKNVTIFHEKVKLICSYVLKINSSLLKNCTKNKTMCKCAMNYLSSVLIKIYIYTFSNAINVTNFDGNIFSVDRFNPIGIFVFTRSVSNENYIGGPNRNRFQSVYDQSKSRGGFISCWYHYLHFRLCCNKLCCYIRYLSV